MTAYRIRRALFACLVLPMLAQADVTVLHNAVIHTVNASAPQASAMAFSVNGEILAVGDSGRLLDDFPDAEHRDLEGRTVIPGLIDSHAHLSGLALALVRAQLDGTQSKAEVIVRLKAHEEVLGEDDWLLGRGWDQNDWPEQAFPTRQDLDEHFPDRPVWLRRIDGHAAWGNSAAIAAADRDLSGDWQEEGGFIHRDGSGQPTGVFIDQAMEHVESAVPAESEETFMKALDLAIQSMVSQGLTGVHDAGISKEVVRRYQQKIAEGQFHTRVYAMVGGVGDTLDWICERGALADPSGRLLMRSLKLYADGALGSRGAALLAPYSDDPHNSGLLFGDVDAVTAAVDRAMGCGLQVNVHAIGDSANRVVLDALAAGMTAHPENPGRHRVEHAQVLSADDLGRFAELGVIAAMQPTHATSDMYWAVERLGEERARLAYAWRSLLDSGARLAFGSDFPVEAVNPMLGLYAAVARQDLEGWPEGGWFPEERVTRAEALRGFTLDAAYAGFMEQSVGSLEVGKMADFVVLDRDLMTVPVRDIADLRVLETWLGGFRVYTAP